MAVLHTQVPTQSSSPRWDPNAHISIEDLPHHEQWSVLAHSSPFFLDSWLQDRFDDVDVDNRIKDFGLGSAFIPRFCGHFPYFYPAIDFKQVVEAVEKKKEKLISVAALKGNGFRGRKVERPRCFEKAPKVVKIRKESAKTIHQPR